MRIISRIKYLKSSADWIEFNYLLIWEMIMIVRMNKNIMPLITTKIVQKSSTNGKHILKRRKMLKSYFWLKNILSTIILSHNHRWFNFLILFLSHFFPSLSSHLIKNRRWYFFKKLPNFEGPYLKILNISGEAPWHMESRWCEYLFIENRMTKY